jgi:hypothetical protein
MKQNKNYLLKSSPLGFDRLSLANNRGASSVLVLLVLLMLVVFGVLALVSSGANLRLAKKNGETVQAWYSLDRTAEIQVAEVVKTVRNSFEKTQDYIASRTFLSENDAILSSDIRQIVKSEWLELQSESERKRFLDILAPKVYDMLVMQEISTLKLQELQTALPLDIINEMNVFSQNISSADRPGLRIKFKLGDRKNGEAGALEVTLEVLRPLEGDTAAYVRVLGWKQIRDAFEYKNQEDLWNGKIKTK